MLKQIINNKNLMETAKDKIELKLTTLYYA